MSASSIAGEKKLAPTSMLFPEPNNRFAGFLKQIYLARGWIRKTGPGENDYEITAKGLKNLKK